MLLNVFDIFYFMPVVLPVYWEVKTMVKQFLTIGFFCWPFLNDDQVVFDKNSVSKRTHKLFI